MDNKVIESAKEYLEKERIERQTEELLDICRVWNIGPDKAAEWVKILVDGGVSHAESVRFLISYSNQKKFVDSIFSGLFYQQDAIKSAFEWLSISSKAIGIFNCSILNKK